MSVVPAAGPYPAFTWSGTEDNPSPPQYYFEDREIHGLMYRTQNAQYNTTTFEWSQIDTSIPSFVTIENLNGSRSYGMKPAGATTSWPTWDDPGLYGVFNILAYGAIDDGMTDCSAAINDAQVAAAAYNGGQGGTVYCPPGKYLCGECIVMDDNVKIIGAFAGNTTLALNAVATLSDGSTKTAALICSRSYYTIGSSTPQSNIAVRNLTLDGGAPIYAASPFGPFTTFGATVTMRFATNVTIENCGMCQ